MVAASTLGEYLPIVLLAGLAFLFAAASLGASALLRPSRPTHAQRERDVFVDGLVRV